MRYAVPEAWHELGVRRWGFHGASHKFIAERSAELLGRKDVARRAQNLYADGGQSPVEKPDLRVISCHLGGSSSITGILNGVAIGNSLGMSPQSGLPHNNRVGDLDAEAIPYAVKTLGLTIEEAQRQLEGRRRRAWLAASRTTFATSRKPPRKATPKRGSLSTSSSVKRAAGLVVTFFR
jgi:acetate kinase